jgi:hypothetical protein
MTKIGWAIQELNSYQQNLLIDSFEVDDKFLALPKIVVGMYSYKIFVDWTNSVIDIR